ncbi:MAG: glycogen/starch synthase [bacterium]|nr:glycogen/starch synthase [bacterium]
MYAIVHLAAECYPIAKVGGLGDVVGALPKYLERAKYKSCVIMPRYNTKWNADHPSVSVFEGNFGNENYNVSFHVVKPVNSGLDYDVYFIDIPYLLFREGVYGYEDDHLRFLFFQQAALYWMLSWQEKPVVLHCHDYHTGLVSFMMNHCYDFMVLAGTKTVFTIHNGLYAGSFPHAEARFIPHFPRQANGLLDWNNQICPLATGIKCSNKVTTVSEGYLDELKYDVNEFNWLYNEYAFKSKGIVNGIDTEVWNPATDSYLQVLLKSKLANFKLKSKEAICSNFGLNPTLPLVVFIGRLNVEKGGEIFVPAIGEFVHQNKEMNFFILGSGAGYIEDQIRHISEVFPLHIKNYIGYNEALAHQLYAASDFLVMPSLVEPCGLNQLYALRYGSLPIVRATGGLKDTVIDIGDEGGYGFRFNEASVSDVVMSLYRALDLYKNTKRLNEIRNRAVALDFSWDLAVKKYIEIYQI